MYVARGTQATVDFIILQLKINFIVARVPRATNVIKLRIFRLLVGHEQR